MKFLKLILTNAGRNKRRTILTILSIVVALFLFSTLQTVLTAFNAGAEVADAARLVTRRSTSLIFPLPLSYMDRISQIPGVSDITYANWFGGVYIDEKNFFAQFAVEPESYLRLYPELILPGEQKQAFLRERTSCIVGVDLAERFGWKVGQNIPLKGAIYPGNWEFTIRGIYSGDTPGVDEATMFFHWDFLNERMGDPSEVGVYITRLADPNMAAQVAEAIDRTFENSLAETRTETEKAFQLSFVSMLGNIQFFITGIGTAVLFTIILVSANTMIMAARERYQEIAVMKTLGFNDQIIFGLVLGEAGLIALIGGILGTLIARVLFQITEFTAGGIFPDFTVQWSTVGIGLILSVVLGLVSGFIPALGASHIQIVNALRHVN